MCLKRNVFDVGFLTFRPDFGTVTVRVSRGGCLGRLTTLRRSDVVPTHRYVADVSLGMTTYRHGFGTVYRNPFRSRAYKRTTSDNK